MAVGATAWAVGLYGVGHFSTAALMYTGLARIPQVGSAAGVAAKQLVDGRAATVQVVP